VVEFYFKLTGHLGVVDSDSRKCKSHEEAINKAVQWARDTIRRRKQSRDDKYYGYSLDVSTSTGQIAFESISA